MTAVTGVVEPPQPLFDLLLRLAPADILLFDSSLHCHYAAPVGDAFLGAPRSRLVGRHAAEILPRGHAPLHTALKRAVRRAVSWECPDYTLHHQAAGRKLAYRCSIRVEPVAMPDFTGALVLFSHIEGLAGERDRLRAELEALRRQEATRTEAIHHLQTQLRSQLTPAVGYLQLLVRRPAAFGGRTAASVVNSHVLPVLGRLVDTFDRLRDLAVAGPDGEVPRGTHEPAA